MSLNESLDKIALAERARIADLFAQSHVSMAILVGPHHVVEFANRSYEALIDRKNIKGMPIAQAIPEISAQGFIELLDQVYEKSQRFEARERSIYLKNSLTGSMNELFLDFSYDPLKDSRGKTVGIMVIAVDVTLQVRARREIERAKVAREIEKETQIFQREVLQKQQSWLESILNRLPSIVLIIEPGTGRALFANNVAKWLYGEDVVEKGTVQRFSKIRFVTDGTGKPLGWDEVPSTRAARGEKIQNSEVIVTTEDGSFNLVVNSEFLPAFGSQPASILIFTQDITAIRLAEQEKREASLQVESERRKLYAIFEQAPVGITIVEGPEHIYELVNESYRRMIQDDRDYIGRRYEDVFPEVAGQGVLEILNDTYRTGRPYHGVAVPMMIRDAQDHLQPRHYDFLLQPLFEEDGSIKRLLTIVLDVSAQVAARSSLEIQGKKIQESEARFRQLADTMPQIVWTARPDGLLNYTNQRWTEYSGSSDPEAWLNFVHPEDIENVMQTWTAAVQSGQAYEAEFRLRRQVDVSFRWHLVRAVQIFDSKGHVTNWFGTCTDIQDQKEIQAEIITAKANAEAANFAKTAFLANMSHEIRTPLGAILGFTDLLNMSDLGSEEKKYLDVIVRNSHLLTRVIDDILDISKIEAGKLDLEKIPFSPKKILNEVVDLFKEKAQAKNVSMHLTLDENVPPELISDPSRLRQILINIVGNAVKFTAQGSIDLLAQTRESSDGDVYLLIQVKDTGVGLDPTQAKKLFQPFTQAESGTNRKFGGTGLGLVISLKLAQALGGDLRLTDSALHKGCTFEIEIRAQASKAQKNFPLEEENKIAASSVRPKRLEGIRVLGVDDSSDNRTLMQFFLKRENADYQEADSGEKALAKIRQGDFDIVLMDIQMPGIDGYETVRILRQEGYKKPIIALTAHAMSEERRRTLASGFDDHVTKPIDAHLLVEAILKQTHSVHQKL